MEQGGRYAAVADKQVRPQSVKMRLRIKSVRHSLASGILISLFLIYSPGWADYIWDGGGGSSNWNFSSAVNWNPDGAPNTAINDSIVFGSSPFIAARNDFSTMTGIQGISFTAAPSEVLIVLGNPLSFASGAIIGGNSTRSHYISTNIISNGPGGIVFNLDTFNLSISTPISTGVAGGGITKSGTGTLTLSGNNTYLGGTTLNSGTIILGNNSALGTGTLTLGGNGTLQSNNNSRSVNNAIATGGNTLTISGIYNLILGGAISGNGSLTKAGTSTLTLSGANTYLGGTTLNSGTIILGNNSALGTGTLTLGGNGTIQSNSDSRSVSNAIATGGSILTVSGVSNLALSGVISGAGALTANMTADADTLTLSGTNTYSGGTTLSKGTIILGNNAALGTGALTLGGAGTLQSDNDSRSVGNAIDTGGNSLTVSGASNLVLGGVISGAGALTKSGAGTLTLSGDNTYTGTTTISQGTLKVSGGSAIADTGEVSLADVAGAFFELSSSETIGLLAGGGTAGGNVTLNANTLTVGDASSTAYWGDITGAGALTKVGSGTLTLGGNNTYSGGTTIIAGGLTGTTSSLQGNITNDAIVTFDQDGDGTYAGTISGGGALTKTGAGTLTLAGNNTCTGLTTLSEGGLILSGQVGGALTLAGGTLSGNGMIGGTLTLSGSTCSPGSSIGTMTIGGDYVQNAGSELEIEVEKTSSGTLRSDLLDVGDSATFEAGSIISVTDISSPSRLIGTGDTFTIIQTGAGVTDNGASVISNSAVLSFAGLISGNDYQLVATRDALASKVSGVNRSSVLGAIDSDTGSAAGDYITLINALTFLNSTRLNYAADKLNALPYASATSFSLRTTQQMTSNLANYLSARRLGLEELMMLNAKSREGRLLIADASNDPGTLAYVINENRKIAKMQQDEADSKIRGFLTPFGVFYEQDSTPGLTGFCARAVGAQFGFDKSFGANLIMGIGGGYGHSFINFNEGRGKGDVDSFRVGPYASCFRDNLFVDTSVSFGYHNNEIERDIKFGTINRTAEGDYHTYDLSAYIGGGYDFHFNQWIVTPTTSLQYICYHRESFKETGAGAAGLDVDAATSESFRSRLGIKLSAITELCGTKIAPELFVGWAHEFMDEENIKAGFADGTAKFTTDVDGDGGDSVYFGAGISALLKENISAFVRYEGEHSAGNDIRTLNVGITILF